MNRHKYLPKLVFAILMTFFIIGVRSHRPLQAAPFVNSVPLMFIENIGQFDDRVRFQLRSSDRTFWLVEDGLWITIGKSMSQESEIGGNGENISSELRSSKGIAIKLSFPGANPHPNIVPFDRLDTHVSTFVGSDPENWYTDVPTWSGVRYEDIYPGIDLEIISDNDRVSQRLVVQNEEITSPALDSYFDRLRLRIDGVDAVTLEGDYLRLRTALGSFTLPLLQLVSSDRAPFYLRAAHPVVDGTDIISPFTASFHHSSLIPMEDSSDLLYSTYVGDSDYDRGNSLVLDAAGNAVVTGGTYSANFPTTAGTFDTTFSGSYDVFILKLAADGGSLLYSTYVGGTSGDYGKAVVLDAAGNAVVTGGTYSADFPITAGAFDTTHNGNGDIYVLKLAADGGSLLYSTYVGGVSRDQGDGLVLDDAGNVVVTGMARSLNFPTTTGAFDNTHNGALDDTFVLKLAADGSSVLYSTYVGGSHDEVGYAVALDSEGNAVVAGRTNSSDFPTTAGSFDTTYNGAYDVFILKLEADGGSLLYSSYVGGSSDENDLGFSLELDAADNVVFTGRTYSSNFPTTASAYDATHNGSSDVFVLKLAVDGSSLLYSTFVGSSGIEIGLSLALDAIGNVVVTGRTNSSNFPTTAGAYDTTYNGGDDAFVLKLAADGGSLLYSTFVGGSGFDAGISLCLDAADDVIFTGRTESPNFPTTVGAYDITYNGSFDVFVTKLSTGVGNGAPTVTVDQPTVIVDEGQTAINSGTVSDPDNDLVALSVSTGTVTNNHDGTWSWNFAASDGPSESQTVTIFADDQNGGITQTIFDLVINNVAPTANFSNMSGSVIEGESATLAFSDEFDPSVADMTTGFLYSYDCTDDGTFEVSDVSTVSFDCPYPNSGNFTARGRIKDKDDGFTDYTIEVTVLTPQEATEAVIDSLQEIVNTNTGTPLADKIEDAIAKAETAVVELTKTPPDNQAAVGNIEGAVGELEAAVKDGLLDAVQGTQFMDQFAVIARHLAVMAIDQAIAQGGDPDEINEAQQELVEGDVLRASEAFKDAVAKYKDALAKAESAIS